jgi:hypothetical protein
MAEYLLAGTKQTCRMPWTMSACGGPTDAIQAPCGFRRDIVHEGNVQAVDAESLQAVLYRTAHSVGRVERDAVMARDYGHLTAAEAAALAAASNVKRLVIAETVELQPPGREKCNCLPLQ